MNVWIDVNHVPQFNFYKRIITTLSEQGHNVWITVLQRGKLLKIIRSELEGLSNVIVLSLGRHRMTKWSAVLEANLLRIPKMWFWKIQILKMPRFSTYA